MKVSEGHRDEAKKHEVEFTIVVNGREKPWTSKEISFEEVVALAYDPVPSGPYVVITVAFRRGQGNKPQGTLKSGESVKVKDGMIFDVTATDKS